MSFQQRHRSLLQNKSGRWNACCRHPRRFSLSACAFRLVRDFNFNIYIPYNYEDYEDITVTTARRQWSRWVLITAFHTNTGSLLSIRGYNLNFSNFLFLFLLLRTTILLVSSLLSEHCLRHNHICWWENRDRQEGICTLERISNNRDYTPPRYWPLVRPSHHSIPAFPAAIFPAVSGPSPCFVLFPAPFPSLLFFPSAFPSFVPCASSRTERSNPRLPRPRPRSRLAPRLSAQ